MSNLESAHKAVTCSSSMDTFCSSAFTCCCSEMPGTDVGDPNALVKVCTNIAVLVRPVALGRASMKSMISWGRRNETVLLDMRQVYQKRPYPALPVM